MRLRALFLVAVVLGLLAGPLPGKTAEGRRPPRQFVLSPEGNHLWAYDPRTNDRQLVARAANGSDPGVEPPAGAERRDINGQVCVSPDGRSVITGEDTVIAGEGGDAGSSRDPRIAGWGYFEIRGTRLGQITVTQQGKLAPETAGGPGYKGDPDNYGCGFLDKKRLVTTAIGNRFPGEEANGQLFIWFAPFDRAFRQETTDGGAGFFVGDVPHCEIDGTLATAGGIAVDDNGDVYVATNRPDDDNNPGAVWRYRGAFPASPEECTPEVIGRITREQVVLDPRHPTPSAVAISPQGTLYVSSVFSGTVAEYTKDGEWVKDVYPLSPVTPPTGPTGNTPFGLAFTNDGSLWIADLGIALAEAGPGLGSVVRMRRDAEGNPMPPAETVRENLDFPDGLGVYTVRRLSHRRK